MAVNYYIKTEVCHSCGHKANDIFIGQSALGHIFVLNGKYGDTLEDYLNLAKLEDLVIYDEHGKEYTIDEMRSLVYDAKSNENFIIESATKQNMTVEDFLSFNHLEIGPNNLLRSVIDGQKCIAHDDMFDVFSGDYFI